jgi:hypothetical protein
MHGPEIAEFCLVSVDATCRELENGAERTEP